MNAGQMSDIPEALECDVMFEWNSNDAACAVYDMAQSRQGSCVHRDSGLSDISPDWHGFRAVTFITNGWLHSAEYPEFPCDGALNVHGIASTYCEKCTTTCRFGIALWTYFRHHVVQNFKRAYLQDVILIALLYEYKPYNTCTERLTSASIFSLQTRSLWRNI